MVICKSENCVKNASFGIAGEGAKFCKKHKSDIMVDVVSQRCVSCNLKQPNYNYEGEKPKYCKDCKRDDMIDIKNKKCIKCKKKQCCFGFEGSIAEYCFECKTDKMIDIKNKKCIECKKNQPSFNFEGNIPNYCGICKKDGMINLNERRICVKCKKTQASIGFPGENRTHCANCRETGMLDLSKIKCLKCKITQPCFGYLDEKPQYCFKCKTDDMINLVSKKCKTNLCETIISNILYEGYCAVCYSNLFPDSQIIKNCKTKERLVVNYIKMQYFKYKWRFDKAINGGTSMRRPDIFLDLGHQIIIIEIDEFQHKHIQNIYEKERLDYISKDVCYRPTVFIRFNPDKYRDKNNQKIKSCFIIDPNTGIIRLNDNNMWEKRLDTLKNKIDYWIENTTTKVIEVVYLYYDGYDA